MLVARHALGRADAYDAALLDVAQDHLLFLLTQTVAFGDGRLVLKVWGDVVDDRRGTRPLRTEDVLDVRREQDFQPDSIGALARPVEISDWEARVRTRAFLANLDADEQRWAACDERHRIEVQNALAALLS